MVKKEVVGLEKVPKNGTNSTFAPIANTLRAEYGSPPTLKFRKDESNPSLRSGLAAHSPLERPATQC